MHCERRFALDGLPSLSAKVIADVIDPNLLRRQAGWIRDDLDPMIARHGPEALDSGQKVMVTNFLHLLRRSEISLEQLRFSRLHLALLTIAGTATRWPQALIAEAETILQDWTSAHGDLSSIVLILYEDGGRLHGVCGPQDISKEALEVQWAEAANSKVGATNSRKHGDLGFKPGDWWINAMFAYHAGIIDNVRQAGRMVADRHAAYALVLNGHDEIESPTPDMFTYRAKPDDPGRFRLTAATPASRHPIRVLRHHTLHSFWSPRAGIRYDGLHKVTGWKIKREESGSWTYEIRFERIPDKYHPMKAVLRHPLAEEVDDYTEYKRIRRLALRDSIRRARPPVVVSEPEVEPPAALSSGKVQILSMQPWDTGTMQVRRQAQHVTDTRSLLTPSRRSQNSSPF